MRNLQTHDLFVAMKLINAAGVREEVKKMALQVQNGKKLKTEEVGADFIFNLIGACGDAKVEALFYDFIGGILEVEPQAVKTMEPLTLFENIKRLGELIDKEAWLNFFHLLANTLAKQN